MTTPTADLVNKRKWATKNLEDILKREAFVNTLKANLQNLTKDIKVGTRFISTNDYDGNLYECKQEIYTELLKIDRKYSLTPEKHIVENASVIPYHKVDITKLIPGESIYYQGQTWIPYDYGRQKEIYDMFMGQTYLLNDRNACCVDVLQAISSVSRDQYNMDDSPDKKWPNIRDVKFRITDVEEHVCTVRDEHPQAGQKYWRFTAEGFFPEVEREVNRIWVRKCNPIAEALGKNIDVSRKSIHFQLEEMNVRQMLDNEVSKLKKIRKIFNKENPRKARSKALQSLKEEQQRLEPTLKRLELLYFDLYNTELKVPAYYTKKYGYLIPINAKFKIEVEGKSFEEELVKKNDDTRETLNKIVEQKREIINDIVPTALHPDRVEKAVEKYGIEGVFGDDRVVVSDYKDGILHQGVVNSSVFG